MPSRRDLREFRKLLLGWFRTFQRDLPWRQNKDPYRIWLSEIMLQQTRVAAVIPYYETFLERFPTIRALAEAPEQEVLRLWSGLGYYSRARNLQRAARQIVATHGGEFPRTADAALALPGVGSYTAAAIPSIPFGAEHAVPDTCRARQMGWTEVIPEKRKKRATVEITLAAAVILDPRGHTLLLPPPHASRKHATHQEVAPLVSKMWHFPTVAVQKDAAGELREFLSRLDTIPAKKAEMELEPLSRARHAVTYRAIKLLPYRVRVSRLPRIAGAKCVLLGELVSRSSVAVSNLTRK